MVEVVCSTVIDAPLETVWAVLRDFAEAGPISGSNLAGTLEGGRTAATVGATRAAATQGGAALRERLIDLDDRKHTLKTCLVDTPLPLYGYVAHQSLRRVTDGDRTFWQWRASFATDPQRRDDFAARIAEDVMAAGFASVRARVGRTRGTGSEPAVMRHGLGPARSRDRPGQPTWRSRSARKCPRQRAAARPRPGARAA